MSRAGLILGLVLMLSGRGMASWIWDGVRAEPRAEMSPTNIVGSGAAAGAVVSNDLIYLNVPDLAGQVAGLEAEDGDLWNGVNENRDNIYLVEFRRMAGETATFGEMMGGVVDAFEDTNGIDAVASSNATFGVGYAFAASGERPVEAGWWKLDDNAESTTVVDSGFGNNNGIATVNTSLIQSNGLLNGAFQFGGGTNVSLFPQLQSLPALWTNAGSVAVWVKLDDWASANWEYFFSIQGDSDYYFWFSVAKADDGRLYYAVVYGWSERWESYVSNVSEYTGWHHFVLTWVVGGSTALYVDGALAVDGSNGGYPDNPILTGAALGISVPSYLNPMSGAMDDARVFTYALSSGEVATLYNGGAGTADSLGTSSTGGAMNLQANPLAVDHAPAEVRGMVLLDTTNAVNADILMDVSGDGATWDRLTLADLGPYSGATRIFGATTNLTAAGTSMVYRVQSATNASGTVRGAAIMWR